MRDIECDSLKHYEDIFNEYSLDNSLMSSFASYLFTEEETNEGILWKGIVHPIAGVEVIQKGSVLFINAPDDCTEVEYLRQLVTGLWHSPDTEIPETFSDMQRSVLRQLTTDLFPGIRTPWLKLNKWHVLLASLLSVHAKTTYSRRWFACIANIDINELLSTEPEQLMVLSKKRSGMSAGYRMRYIVETLHDLKQKYAGIDDPLDELEKKPPELARVELLGVRNIGPKVADCFLLNALGDTTAPPIDVNVKRIAENLGIVPPEVRMPSAGLCKRFACIPNNTSYPTCPRAIRTIEYLEERVGPSGTCIRAAFTQLFRDAGWIQAVLFAFAKKYCVATSRRLPPCRKCPVTELCIREKVEAVRPVRVRAPRLRERTPRLRKRRPRSSSFEFRRICLFDLYEDHESEVERESKQLFEEVKAKGLRPGRGNNVLSAACIWLACRINDLPVLAKEVALTYQVGTSDFLKLSSDIRNKLELIVPIAKPVWYCERFCKQFGLGEEFTTDLCTRAERARGPSLSGKSPTVVAAALVCASARKLHKQLFMKRIASALGVSEVSIRNTLSELQLQL